ncbi:hypothetical protein [Schnuerera sp.]|uniref:hypothetical protein n=1 Tax=Schnuerera sp. TaxID=2794844 RepID=UPI002C48AF1C|nr:hypothetical protein [Schnuerera sp.]HSH35412.1 hypothetical protein [Schnuerera sp.]
MMKHYDEIEWIFYKEKILSDEKQTEMEEHLYTCDRCMEIFLSLIDEQEADKAKDSISENFTANLMGNIENVQYKPKTKAKKSNTRFKDMFVYYVAVASVAIVLTLGGFYSGLVDMVPQIGKSNVVKNNINAPNIIANVSGKIVNRTSNFINNFEIPKSEENLK